ncbi:MAG TPA: DUF2252 domain-containing protein [Solirubrobacterales bacterium]|nr:DUF2252 domain-containing protein [Solirubrobacterales bacterium]
MASTPARSRRTEPAPTAQVTRPARDTGRAAGRAARAAVPRSEHGAWAPGAGRRDPLAILAEQDAARVPELVPVRYGRMLASAFTFYRGAAAIMAADLGAAPDTGLRAQLCGDAHLSNFGAFQAPDRRLVFDINDFDETLPGPFEWDVKRLAASFEIGGRDRGFGDRVRRRCVLAVGREYRKAMRRFAAMGELDVWYARLDVADVVGRLQSRVTAADRRRFAKNIAKARNKDSLRALDKLTEATADGLRIADRPPVLVPIAKLAGDLDVAAIEELMGELLGRYRETVDDHIGILLDRFRFVDAGHKVVGVGSVGTRAWIALLMGRDHDDPLFLQVKQAGTSVLEPFAGPSEFGDHGRRVVAGQRLMQAAGDVFLGWLHGNGLDGVERHFYVRQLWDGKGSAEIEALSPGAMEGYAELCAWSLARAHARSGDRAAIAAYLGKSEAFDRAIAAFADAYADQNEADYARLLRAKESGDLVALRGV